MAKEELQVELKVSALETKNVGSVGKNIEQLRLILAPFYVHHITKKRNQRVAKLSLLK